MSHKSVYSASLASAVAAEEEAEEEDEELVVVVVVEGSNAMNFTRLDCGS